MNNNFLYKCPLCNTEMLCDKSLNGQIVNCPNCGGEVVPEYKNNENIIKNSDQNVDNKTKVNKKNYKDVIKFLMKSKSNVHNYKCPRCNENYSYDDSKKYNAYNCIKCGELFIPALQNKWMLTKVLNIWFWFDIICAIGLILLCLILSIIAVLAGYNPPGVGISEIAICISLLIDAFFNYIVIEILEFIQKYMNRKLAYLEKIEDYGKDFKYEEISK